MRLEFAFLKNPLTKLFSSVLWFSRKVINLWERLHTCGISESDLPWVIWAGGLGRSQGFLDANRDQLGCASKSTCWHRAKAGTSHHTLSPAGQYCFHTLSSYTHIILIKSECTDFQHSVTERSFYPIRDSLSLSGWKWTVTSHLQSVFISIHCSLS